MCYVCYDIENKALVRDSEIVLRLSQSSFRAFESEFPMNQNGKPTKKNKAHLIGFRVDEDAFNEVESRALLAGKNPNDWCRDELLARLADGSPLTANEELIHADIVRYGNVLATFLHLIANKQLTPDASKQLLDTLQLDRKEVAKKYFSSLAKVAREGN
jgi:hypothetical protein